jgi:DNA-binding MarR family transcriptional regulator
VGELSTQADRYFDGKLWAGQSGVHRPAEREDLTIRTVIASSEDPLCAGDPFFQIQRAARALARGFDSELRPLSLTNGQFILLMLLNRQEPPGMAGLSSLLAMDRTTLTAALKTLERRDLVRIVNDPTDHRVRRMRLTRRGRALIMASLPIWKRTSLEIESRLAGTDLDSFRQILQALC